MKVLKKRIILLTLLILSILSVIFAINTVTTEAATPSVFQVISRVGNVIYLPEKRKVIISSSGSMLGGGQWTWDDVCDMKDLLCCEEFGPIPGRTLANGETLDFQFHPVDGGPVLDYQPYVMLVKSTKDYVITGKILDLGGTPMVGRDHFLKVFNLSDPIHGVERWYKNNSYALYESQGVTTTTNTMEAYILAELDGNGKIEVKINVTGSGEFEYHEWKEPVMTTTGTLTDGYGSDEGEVVVYYGEKTRVTINESQYQEARGKAGHASYKMDANGRYYSESYGDAFIKNPNGEGYVAVTVFSASANIQIAWWATITGGQTSGNDLSDEAAAFAAYRRSFKEPYKPQWVVDGDCKDVYVYNDLESGGSQIGLLAIDYVESHCQVGSRPYVQFAGIVDFEVFVDGKDEPLKLGEGFEFVWVDGQRTEKENKQFKFPKPNERFYIKLKDINDATKITDMKVTFRWMSAQGTFETVTGYYIELYFKASDTSRTLGQDKHYINRDHEAYEGSGYWSKGSDGHKTEKALIDFMKNNGEWTYDHFEINEKNYYYRYQDYNVTYTTKEEVLDDYYTYNGNRYDSKSGFKSAYMADKQATEAEAEAAAASHHHYNTRWIIEGDDNQRTMFIIEFKHDKSRDIKKPSQKLVWGGGGQRWYDYCELHRQISFKTGTIQVHKDIVDESGKIINDIDPNHVFQVQVKVTNCQNPYVEIINVKPGQTVSAPIVYWEANGSAPQFEVEELSDPDYKCVSIEPASGTIPDEGTRAVTVNIKNAPGGNGEPHSGRIAIDKDIIRSAYFDNLPDDIKQHVTLENRNFIFKVRISGTFSYEGNDYSDTTYEFEQSVVSNGAIWTSSEITWRGNKAPTYEIIEVKAEGLEIRDKDGNWIEDPNPVPGVAFEIESQKGSSGSLIDGETIVVNFKNKYKEEYAALAIIKNLIVPGDNDRLDKKYDIAAIERTTFTFRIKVEGYPERNIVLYPERVDNNESSEDNEYVWKYTSEDIYWVHGANLQYEIEEIETENPIGTQFDSARTLNREENKEIDNFKVEGKVIKGQLKANEEKQHKVVNYLINIPGTIGESKIGKISVQKEVDDTLAKPDAVDGKIIGALHNKKYYAIVTITGTFEYTDSNGKKYECNNETLQLTKEFTNDSGEKVSAVKIENQDYNLNYIELEIGEGEAGITRSEKWTSQEIKWKEGTEAPKFKVQEVLQGIDCSSSVLPGSGSIISGETVDVEITNIKSDIENLPKKGYLKLYKEFEEVEGKSLLELCTPEYINSLSFDISLKVDYANEEREDQTKIITLGKDNFNTEKKRWESDILEFTWEYNEDNPQYEVEEVAIRRFGEITDKIIGKDIKKTGKIPESENEETKDANNQNIVEILNLNTIEEVTIINTFPDTDGGSHKGKIKIEKEITDDSLKDYEYKFIVTFEGKFSYDGGEPVSELVLDYNDVVVKPGTPWESAEIKWYGEDSPKYYVKEYKPEEDSNDYVPAKEKSSYASSGIINEGTTVTVRFVNEPEYEEEEGTPFVAVIKKMDPNNTFGIDKEFKFKITVTYPDGTEYTEVRTIGVNGKFEIGPYKWLKGTTAPTFVVEELDPAKGQVASGSFSSIGDNPYEINVDVINNVEEGPKHGNALIEKAVIANKYSAAPDEVFTMRVVIGGEFAIGSQDGEKVTGSKTYDISLTAGQKFATPEFYWWGDKAPTVRVIEDDIDNDSWWRHVDTSNNGASLVDGGTTHVVVTNQWDPEQEYDLTIEFAGIVWNDTPENTNEKGTSRSVSDGLYDASREAGVEGVKVYVYKNGGELADVMANITNAPIQQPIITDGSGYWETPRIKTTQGATYYVEFEYDGQTYQATENYMVSGDASAYKSAKDNEKTKWFNNSMAKDINREEANSKLQEIYGGSPINGNGNTEGRAKGSAGELNLHYKAELDDPEVEKYRISSKLQTKKADGTAYEEFEVTARTVELSYPFDKQIVLANVSQKVSPMGSKAIYNYSATYPYCKHINLGLETRPEADLGASKYLKSAKVKFQGKEYKYDFNTIDDFGVQHYTRTLQDREKKDDDKEEFVLGLYSTGYYYRAEVYQADSQIYDAIVNKDSEFKKLDQLQDTELKVELTYVIEVYNESQTYTVKVNAINDYADENLGKPIETIGTNNNWQLGESIKGSDGTIYRKMSLNLNDSATLQSGQCLKISVTYEIQKRGVEAVRDCIIDGMKSNIVEIANYSTFNQDGTIAGKVDRDSAPDNINIRDYNIVSMYEDDTDCAELLELTVLEDKKDVVGTVWEDRKDEDKSYGDGKFKEDNDKNKDEARIAGLTTQMMEVVEGYDSDGNRHEYEFLWPTSRPLDAYGGKTIKILTGFDSSIETATKETIEQYNKTKQEGDPDLSAGDYRFANVPSGYFKIKFAYGNNKYDLKDTVAISGPAYAVTKDGEYWNKPVEIVVRDETGTEETKTHQIYTANYDKKDYSNTPATYNGQDYKATLYYAKSQDGIVLNDNKLEFKTISDNPKKSFARDDEIRRLETIAKSETIKNANGMILATANEDDSTHTELYREYSMFADTAVLNMKSDNPEFNAENGGVFITKKKNSIGENDSGVAAKIEGINYRIEDLDFGLIERPETSVILDKQIDEIKIITNDNKVIFDAQYNISYEKFIANTEEKQKRLKQKTIVTHLKNNDYLVANVSLDAKSIGVDVLQAIDKFENKLVKDEIINENTLRSQNFRYVQIDDTVLQGTTIKITYQYTALNVGEEDYVSTTLAGIQDKVIDTNKKAKNAQGTAGSGSNEETTTVKAEIANLIHKLKQEKDDREKAGPKGDIAEVKVGEYLGMFYYTGAEVSDKKAQIVKTRVRQLVDYVDNDAVFDIQENMTDNHSWRNTTITELTGGGKEDAILVGRNVIPQNDLLDKNEVRYITDKHNNIILSVDSAYSTDGTDESNESNEPNTTAKALSKVANDAFERELMPYSVLSNAEKTQAETKENSDYHSTIRLQITKVVAAESDSDNMAYDNMAEIVVLENTVGRRDMLAVPGNANPRGSTLLNKIAEEKDTNGNVIRVRYEKETSEGEFGGALPERDSSATELITFTPPTGVYFEEIIKKQSYAVILIGLIIATVGIVVIKKFVIPKNKKEQ